MKVKSRTRRAAEGVLLALVEAVHLATNTMVRRPCAARPRLSTARGCPAPPTRADRDNCASKASAITARRWSCVPGGPHRSNWGLADSKAMRSGCLRPQVRCPITSPGCAAAGARPAGLGGLALLIQPPPSRLKELRPSGAATNKCGAWGLIQSVYIAGVNEAVFLSSLSAQLGACGVAASAGCSIASSSQPAATGRSSTRSKTWRRRLRAISAVTGASPTALRDAAQPPGASATTNCARSCARGAIRVYREDAPSGGGCCRDEEFIDARAPTASRGRFEFVATAGVQVKLPTKRTRKIRRGRKNSL